MAHVRYLLEGEENRIETGGLLYVTITNYGKDWRSFLHTHYFSELFYVTSGSGQFQVQDEKFDVHKGDLVLINPHTKHTELSSKTESIACIVLGIEHLIFTFGKQASGFTLIKGDSGHSHIEYLLNQLVIESREQKERHLQVCQNTLEVLLIQLMRNTKFDLNVAPAQDIPSECRAAKHYIDMYGCTETITLDKLAQLTHLNKFYLSHSFKKAYGISPINYLLTQRVQCAKEHLGDTNLSIAQVAQTSGFSSQSYFSQMFKKATGISPVEYRELAAHIDN